MKLRQKDVLSRINNVFWDNARCEISAIQWHSGITPYNRARRQLLDGIPNNIFQLRGVIRDDLHLSYRDPKLAWKRGEVVEKLLELAKQLDSDEDLNVDEWIKLNVDYD